MNEKNIDEFPWRCRHGHQFRECPERSVCPVCSGKREHDDTDATPQQQVPQLDWHKLVALLMFKFNVKEVILDARLVDRMEKAFTPEDQATVVCHAHADCIVLKLMKDSEATKLLEHALVNGAKQAQA